MAIGLGGHDTNSRALHQARLAQVSAQLWSTAYCLSDRHFRLFATLLFDYQNRHVGARKLPLGRCRLLEKIKICGREVGRWREGERVRTIGTILDKEESVSRFSSPVLEERMERKTLTSSNMNGPRSQEDGKKCGSSFDHQPRRRAREKERQIPMLVWRFKNRLCHRGMQI